MKSRSKHSSNKNLQNRRKSSVLDAAGELGVDPETLRRYIREGAPHDSRNGKHFVDVPEVMQWMQSNGRSGKQGIRPDDESPDLEAVRIRKETALAEKYELQTAKERGQLIPVEATQQWLIRNLTSARNYLLGIPAKAVVLMAGRNAAEQQSILETLIREALETTANLADDLGDGMEAA